MSSDVKGEIYEGLLQKNAEDIKSGAGQYLSLIHICNIPLSMGVPSICFGGYRGHGAHTREEYIEVESLLPGMKAMLSYILEWF